MAFWRRTWVARAGTDRLAQHGDFARTRERFFARSHSNLRHLVASRYRWMQPWVGPGDRVVELGAGPGFAREYLACPGLELTDVVANPWLDRVVDAMALPYAPGSLDAVICSHMIHHVPRPAALLRSIATTLKPGGRLLVNESNASWCHRFIMWAMRHEGWSYDVDIFDDEGYAKSTVDPLAGNNAVADLLFNDRARFSRHFPGLSIREDACCELFQFLVSGGVGGEVRTLELRPGALDAVAALDRLLVGLAPGTFALARRLVIVKDGGPG